MSVIAGSRQTRFCVSLLLAIGALSAPAQPVVETPTPERLPVEATNAVATFRIKPGFRIQLVAAEPLVVDPVAMAFDEDGRLFVAEMRDYLRRRDVQPHLGHIRMLTDTNHDGVFDTSTVYAHSLPWPSALICYDGGVFVAATPDIIYFKDVTGDGVADEKEVVFTGFGNPASALTPRRLVNSFAWGLDNRIHGLAAGLGGNLRALQGPPSTAVPLHRQDFSFDPRTLTIAAESGTARSGLGFDNRGRRLVCDETRHARLVMYAGRYAARNPFYAMPSPVMDLAEAATPLFPLSPGAARWSYEQGSQFSTARGLAVYRGDAFPAEYLENLFVCFSEANLVHRDTLQPRGLELAAMRPDSERRTEFLASNDSWFRPMALVNGPDGALYLADMYREILAPPEAPAAVFEAQGSLTNGADRGRIYRIVPTNFRQAPRPQLSKATAAQLVGLLAHSNGWHRDTAARLLYERQDKSALPALMQLLNDPRQPAGRQTVPLARLHALHALEGLQALTEAHLLRGLRDLDERVREHAVLLSDKLLARAGIPSNALRERLRQLTPDPSPLVRYQLAFTLGEMAQRDKIPALAEIIRRDLESPWVQAAVLSSLADGAGEMCAGAVREARFRNSVSGQEFLRQLAMIVGTRNDTNEVAQALESIARTAEPQLAFSLLQQLGAGLRRAGTSLPAADPREILQPIYAHAALIVADYNYPLPLRLAAIQLLGTTRYDTASAALLALLNPNVPLAEQTAAVRSLAGQNDPRIGTELVRRWRLLAWPVRAEALTILLARSERTDALLTAIERQVIFPAELGSTHIQLLLGHSDPEVQRRAAGLLGRAARRTRTEILDQFQPALELPGAPTRGREIFLARCASCHSFAGEGYALGPDLQSARGRSKAQMLMDVLDPNREATPTDAAHLVETKDGEMLLGVLRYETPGSVILQQAGGIDTVVLRSNLQRIQPLGLSFMPEGLETGLPPQGLADLLAYFLTTRQ